MFPGVPVGDSYPLGDTRVGYQCQGGETSTGISFGVMESRVTRCKTPRPKILWEGSSHSL